MSQTTCHAKWRLRVAGADPASLPPDQIDDLLHHAEECPDCAAELNDFAAQALARQARAAPRLGRERSEKLRERILLRAVSRGGPSARGPAPAGALARHSGWLAAAALVVGLITHHGFHEPLDSGWLLAAGFALLALGLAAYVLSLRAHAAELRRRLEPPDKE